MSFFEELKRRNVFRVGIAYGVASWLLLQIADLVFPRIGVDDSVITIMIAVLAIGFIPALLFAWVFEMTPEGLKRESEVDRSTSVTHQTAKKLDYITLAALAGVVLLVFMSRQTETTPVAAPEGQVVAESSLSPAPVSDRKSVAVLPFDFRSSNPEDEFFAEGMHDDLLTQLAKIGSLKVISRTSVMEYKDTIKKIPEIAKELGVATIVEGGVQRSGSRIRINAQLIDAQSDEHLWAETFNRELTAENLFDIQAEISIAIANALHATLSPSEEAQINRVLTKNLAAWESYQRALRLRLLQQAATIERGLTEVDHALELDTGFAAAMSLKAILLLQKFWFLEPDPADRALAWELIEKGRAIDPGLPELNLAEGYYHYWGYLDYDKAMIALDRAVEALPNDARIHTARAYVLRRQGDWEGNLSAMRRALEISPRDSTGFADMGNTLAILKRFEEADEAFARSRMLDPDTPQLLIFMAELTWKRSGDIESARRFFRSAPYAFAQAARLHWHAAMSDRDFTAALEIVAHWPEDMLNVRVFNYSRAVLEGLTLTYTDDADRGRELLASEEPVFKSLVDKDPSDANAAMTLCRIMGGLGNTEAARNYCLATVNILPQDAFAVHEYYFDLACGLAEAGDTDGAIKLLSDMLALDASPTIYRVMQHPAFDGLREHPDYIALIEQHRHWVE